MLVHNTINNHANGFTLIELIITIAIAGILAGIGIPSFNQAIRNSRLTTSINRLVSAMQFARSEAIKRSKSVTVRKIGGTWSDGWTVFVDENGDGMQDSIDEVLRKFPALPNGYTLNTTSNRVTFRPTGISGNASFGLCDESSTKSGVIKAGTSRIMIINSVGRVRVGVDTDNDGIPQITDDSNMGSCTSPFG